MSVFLFDFAIGRGHPRGQSGRAVPTGSRPHSKPPRSLGRKGPRAGRWGPSLASVGSAQPHGGLLLPEGARGAALPRLVPRPAPRLSLPHCWRSSAGRERRWAGVSWLPLWLLPRKEEALSADQLSAGFPVPERRRFPGTAATPGIPSPGCRRNLKMGSLAVH
ncbi:uncharacterized protein LOC120885561 [Ictidomys tridecemlineatus]